jgi:isocitrate/isopropylmalate dehydrogenase
MVGLKGPVTTPVGTGFQSLNVQLRKRLDLFANVRPVKRLPGLKTRFQDVAVDMIIFRENTEDLYSGLENEVVSGVITSIKVITRQASTRIAEYAFRFARRVGRKKITAVHKANIMKLGDGLFIRCCQEVSQKFPEIQYNELIVDNASMQLVMRPEQFDILLMPNLYGDIISDLAAGLVGGLGIVPGANMGEQHAICEAVHGSAPNIAGKGLANQTALLQSAAFGQQCGTRRRTERGRVELRVAQPVLRQPIHRGRGNRAAERARRPEADIVGEDEQDVGRTLGRRDLLRKIRCGVFHRPTDLSAERLVRPRQAVLRRRRLSLSARYSQQQHERHGDLSHYSGSSQHPSFVWRLSSAAGSTVPTSSSAVESFDFQPFFLISAGRHRPLLGR